MARKCRFKVVGTLKLDDENLVNNHGILVGDVICPFKYIKGYTDGNLILEENWREHAIDIRTIDSLSEAVSAE